MKKFSEARAFSFFVLALAALFLSAAFITNATSIGTNVTVDGTFTGQGVNIFSGQLQASSTALLGAAATFYSTAGIGTTSPAQLFSVHGNALISGNLSSVANVTATGTLAVTGQSTLTGGAGIGTSTLSQLLSVHGNALISGNLSSVANVTATGTLNVTGLTTLVSATTTHIGVTGTASTTNLVVGGGGSTIAGLNFGFCNLNSGNISASSTKAVNCTSATGVATNDRVFVMATSSLPTNLVILSASSSAANVISLYIRNVSDPGTTVDTSQISVNFWTVR